MDAEEQITRIITKYSGRAAASIQRSDHLTFDLEIDSDDGSFGLIPEVERIFKIYPPASEWNQVETVQDLLELVHDESQRSLDDQWVKLRQAERYQNERSSRRVMWLIGLGFLLFMAIIFGGPTWLRICLITFVAILHAFSMTIYARELLVIRKAQRRWQKSTAVRIAR